ncbi:MAG: insulinase family protein [Acidobacteriia bacterium]|nr:insulinase family protein [Terriglobia bacterium]
MAFPKKALIGFTLAGMLVGVILFAQEAKPAAAPADRGAKQTPPSTFHREDPRTMKFAELKFTPPKPERVTLENGMTVFLLEDHELPTVDAIAAIRTGSIYEPAEKLGLASLTGTVMRSGGTKDVSADQLNEELEFLAASIETSVSAEEGTASLSVMKKDLDRGLQLFANILRSPAFTEDRLMVAKNQLKEAIRRRNDVPSQLTGIEFNKLLYGSSHPLARVPTAETVDRITREDLVQFHQKYFHPNALILGVTGDFNTSEMLTKLKEAFKGWEKVAVTYPPVEEVKLEFKKSVNLIERPIDQTNVRLGQLGIKLSNPDFFPLSVMNSILGSGFHSRLVNEIRTKMGLAYAVGSILNPGERDYGNFWIQFETKPETTLKAMDAALLEVRKIQEQPVSQEELDTAKDIVLNSFVFRFSDSSQIVSRRVDYLYYGLPDNFLETYRDKIAKVTREDIQRVAKQYLHPDQFVMLAVGDSKKFDQPLSTLGEVHTIAVK